jgi:hypothetical protein
MCGVIPPLPNTPSWHGTKLKKAQGQLYLYIYKTSTLTQEHLVSLLAYKLILPENNIKNPRENYVLLLDYKCTLPKNTINNTRFVRLKVSATGNLVCEFQAELLV